MSTRIRRSDAGLAMVVVLATATVLMLGIALAKTFIDHVASGACHETDGVWVDSAEVCVHVRLLEPKKVPVVHPDGKVTFTVAKDWRQVSENTGKYPGSRDNMAASEEGK